MNYNNMVSVIVPVYGVEEYLPLCLDSILAQNYSNIEVILVEDESPDRCAEICDDYARKDVRVRVFHKKNGGAASARNIGLDNAFGKYVCFVDSDDVICNTYISMLVNKLEESESDIAVCSYYKLYKSKKEKVECVRSNEVICQKEYLLQFLDDWTCSLIWNKIFKKEKIGRIRFAEGHKIDDEFFTYQVVMNSDKVILFDEPLYEYRMRLSSVMGEAKKYEREIILDKLEYMVERYRKVTMKFPDLKNSYIRNLMDNLIILLHKSQYYDDLQLMVWAYIRKYKWAFLFSSASIKEKIGYLYAVYRSQNLTESPKVEKKIMEDYFK